MFGRLLFQQTVRQPLILPRQTAIQPDIPLDATAARQYLVPPQKSQRRLPISNASLQNLYPARSAISASALIFHHMPRPFQAFQQVSPSKSSKRPLFVPMRAISDQSKIKGTITDPTCCFSHHTTHKCRLKHPASDGIFSKNIYNSKSPKSSVFTSESI